MLWNSNLTRWNSAVVVEHGVLQGHLLKHFIAADPFNGLLLIPLQGVLLIPHALFSMKALAT